MYFNILKGEVFFSGSMGKKLAKVSDCATRPTVNLSIQDSKYRFGRLAGLSGRWRANPANCRHNLANFSQVSGKAHFGHTYEFAFSGPLVSKLNGPNRMQDS